jgi:HAE1 family hydrophobic/amphiphilic exporter-1
VGDVQLRGDRSRQINIYLDAYRMRAYDITTPDIISALQEQNVDIPGGRVEQSERTLTLRTRGRILSVSDFNRVLLRSGGGGQVRLSDVARVEDGEADEITATQLNGKTAVQLAIYKQSGANTLEVIKDVKKRMETLSATRPRASTSAWCARRTSSSAPPCTRSKSTSCWVRFWPR